MQSIVKTASVLIAFRTESEHGTDFERAANYMLRILEGIGFDTRVLGSDARPIIVGTNKVAQAKTNIFLHGHYDVDPAGDLSAWTTDPFTPVVENGKLFGRGSADMKGGLAVNLEVARILASEETQFPANLFITMTPDAELGSRKGAALLMKEKILPHGKNCFGLMPECTGITTIWHAFKGSLWYEIRILGKQAHGTLPSQGINAFEHMCDLVSTRLSPLKIDVESRRSKFKGERPEYSYASMNIGGYSVGEKSISKIPGVAIFTIDRRIIPEENLLDAQNEIKRCLEEYSTFSEVLLDAKQLIKSEPCVVEEDHPLCQILTKNAEKVLSKRPQFALYSSQLDIHFFNRYGIPMVAYGAGTLARSYVPNEYVEVDLLGELAKIYLLTCLDLSKHM